MLGRSTSPLFGGYDVWGFDANLNVYQGMSPELYGGFYANLKGNQGMFPISKTVGGFGRFLGVIGAKLGIYTTGGFEGLSGSSRRILVPDGGDWP